MKTVEDAQEDYVNNTFIEPDTYIGEIYDAFKAGVKFATRWIPVEEELPKKLVQVIVKLENGWHTTTWIAENGDFAFNVKPTHWRPIDIK